MGRGLFVTGFTVTEVLAIQQRAKEFLIRKAEDIFRAKAPLMADRRCF
jgi:hypothetical protein